MTVDLNLSSPLVSNMGFNAEEFKLRPAYERKEVTDNSEILSIKKELSEIKILMRQMIEQNRQSVEQNQQVNQQINQSANQLITDEFSKLKLDLVKLSDNFIALSEDLREIIQALSEMQQMIERSDQKIIDSVKVEIGEIKELINEIINQSVNRSTVQLRRKERKLEDVSIEQEIGSMPDRLVRVLHAFEKLGSEWVTHEQLGAACEPTLTKDGARGYVSELINNFDVNVEKKKAGRTIFVRLVK